MKSEGDLKDITTPFHSLRVGDFLEFSLFSDVPPETVRLREGVLVSVEVQLAQLRDGTTTVQTLLGLVNRGSYSVHGKTPEPEEIIPLEALEVVKVESGELISAWADIVPALGGRKLGSPVEVRTLVEDPVTGVFQVSETSKSAKQKKSKKGLNSSPAELYISKRR